MTPLLPIVKRLLGWAGYVLAVFILAGVLMGIGYLLGNERARRDCLNQALADAQATLTQLHQLSAQVDVIERSMLTQAEAHKRRQLQLQQEFNDYANRAGDAECLDDDGLRLWRDAITGDSQPADRGDGAVPGAGPAGQRHAPGAAEQPPGQHGDAPRLPPTPARLAGLRVRADAGTPALPAPVAEIPAGVPRHG